MKPFSCAVVGASGMVGQNFIKILEERNTPLSKLYLFASARSAGRAVRFKGGELAIEELTHSVFDRGIDMALFGVEAEVSREYAPIAAKKGCVVVDNSSAWRLDPEVPLVVPEVNGEDIPLHKGIIANPNCCAAPAVVALNPLHKAYTVKRIVFSTYQSVSGAGVGGWEDLERTVKGEAPQHFPYPIAYNVIPHIDRFYEDGYTGEEAKLIAETKKMLHAPEIKATATTVRVPVFTGHSLSVNVSFEKAFDLAEARKLLAEAPGVRLQDDPARNVYPMPITAAGTDLVYVGRVRRDESFENSLNLWVVADNVRKGAATNAVQIAERVMGC
ncbi:MAG: aspartate-semialdehyde dehydrogenase [Clostridiales bacterium]|jgi:aspartate-semialdehyde dehydrogenase|nr:aspartate-semialdehyde dehydrogenase [Clostridiales bacterium]